MFNICVAAAITFGQSSYNIGEDRVSIQLQLFLSNPSSTNFTVELISTDGSAAGNQQMI